MAKRTIPKKVKKEINKFIKVLRKDNLPIDKVFLFGSYAKGKQHKWSDVDVCVISPKFKNTWAAMRYLWQRRPSDKLCAIEPVGLSPKDFDDEFSTLVKEIKNHGIRVR